MILDTAWNTLRGEKARAARYNVHGLTKIWELPNMGWSFRKSINLGPFRINFSSGGVSFSVGAGGLRTGIDTKGKRYNSVSIPGTGLRYYKKTSKKKGTS